MTTDAKLLAEQIEQTVKGTQFQPDLTEEEWMTIVAALRRTRYVNGEPWLPMLTAPLDETEVQLMVRHFDYFTALKVNGQEAADGMYQGPVVGKWIDHNGGGWTWSGHAGSPVAWRPLNISPLPHSQEKP